MIKRTPDGTPSALFSLKHRITIAVLCPLIYLYDLQISVVKHFFSWTHSNLNLII